MRQNAHKAGFFGDLVVDLEVKASYGRYGGSATPAVAGEAGARLSEKNAQKGRQRREISADLINDILSAGTMIHIFTCSCVFFFNNCTLSSGAGRSFRALSAARHAGSHLYTKVQVWVPGGFRGACSGRAKSRNLASNHGVAFRGARAEQDNGKPTLLALFLLRCCTATQPRYDTRYKLSRCYSQGHYLCMCVLRVCVREPVHVFVWYVFFCVGIDT